VLAATTVLGWPARGEAQVAFRLGHGAGPNHHIYQAAQHFKEVVERRTGNAVRVDNLGGGVLGTEEHMLVAMSLGTLDMGLIVAGPYGTIQPEFQLFSLVYMFRDEQHAEKVFRGPILEEMAGKMLAAKNVRVLAPFFYFGKRHLTANKPIRGPEDLKGIRVRVPNVRIHQEGVASLGGQATPLNWPEVYLGLKQGVVDAQEGPLSNTLDAKLYEVQKYLVLSQHITTNLMLAVNERSFQRLNAEQKKIFMEAAQEAEAYNNELARKGESTALEELKAAGMTVVVPDVAAFIRVTEPVRQKYAKDYAAVYRRIQETR
jgi:tripartite ATP-independent transporter DctP family solute receptor